jgi:hypothetical protein
MATNQVRWVGNIDNDAAKPLIMPGLFQAGATQAIKQGELLELTAETNTEWTPMDSDFAMDSNVAIAWEEIKSGDRAGYYRIMVPRKGDIFEFDYATATNPSIGDAVYWSDSETVTTSGTNILGYIAGHDHYPAYQGHLSEDNSPDSGETIRTTSTAIFVIRHAASYISAIQVD